MLRLLLSKDWMATRDEILSRIALDVSQEQKGRILMVPELISHDTERRLCAAAGDTASRFAEVLSFTRLVRRVAEYVGHAAEPCMDNGGRVVAMAAAARQLHSRLKAYAAVETKPEFLKELVDAVDEFKRCCITSEDLLSAAKQTEGSLAQKLEELALLLEAYDGLCRQGKRDPRDQMNWLLQQLEDSDFARDHVFYIDGFPDYTKQHLAILEHLVQYSPCVTVGLNCDSVHTSALAFEKAGQTAAQLINCAQKVGAEIRIEVLPGRSGALPGAWDKLFQGRAEATPETESCIHAGVAESVWQEVQTVCERILELVRGGCRYRDIGIVCADMAAYQSILSLVFQRSGIPVYFSGTEEILHKSVVATVLSALNAVIGGFEQRDVLRYLRSVLSPVSPDLCDRMENYAITWGIRGKRWQEDWVNHPDGLGEMWTEKEQGRLAQLNDARSRALDPLFKFSDRFRTAKNLAQQADALNAFLEDIALAKRLSALADALDAAGDNRTAQILNQLWEILLNALEQMYDVLGQTVWDGESFLRLFTLLLSQYDVGTIPPVLDSVMAGPVSAMRCQQEKYLFVLGAVEGNLPGYGGATGVLTDQERVTLRRLGVPLTGGAMEGIQAEFAEIYGMFCGATETVWVSYPGGQPSYLYRRIACMAGGEEKLEPTLEAALTDPREAGIYLARWGEAALAQQLRLDTWYTDAKKSLSYELGDIRPENVTALYGEKLNLSASQVDRQAECRMSYFLKYGLRAKERKEATIDPAEFGTYVHAVLEETARQIKALGSFPKVSLEQTLQIAKACSDAYTAEHFSQLASERMNYLFRRNLKELEMVVQELWQELQTAGFQPEDFEVAFGDDGKLPAIQIPGGKMEAALRGFVDRVDTWKTEDGSYFRVVDYKTGKKDFDYCDVFNGVGLQMLLYLFALESGGEEVVGENSIAAGVQYFPARVPFVAADGKLSDEEAQLVRQKEWKRRGLLLHDEKVLQAMEPGEQITRLCCTRKKDGTLSGDLADHKQLRMLERYLFRVLGNMVDEIASGCVEPNPYTRGTSHNACTFCPYGAVCHQKSVTGRRNYKAMTAQRFWEEIEKEVGGSE